MLLCYYVLQQSAAFKILRTRLKTVPSHTFMHVQPSPTTEFPGLSAIRRTASQGGYSQILSHIPAMPSGPLNASEDGDKSIDINSSALGINFAAQLKQFEHMQHQHHLYQSQNVRPPRRPITPPPMQVHLHPTGFCPSLRDFSIKSSLACLVIEPGFESWEYSLNVHFQSKMV